MQSSKPGFDEALGEPVSTVDRTDSPKDDLDKAAVLQEQMNQDAIAAVRASMGPEHDPDFDGASCVDCDDDLVESRLLAGRIRCWHCQTNLEQKRKRYA
jgi:RNA polymerase-binding transcription factor DksA